MPDSQEERVAHVRQILAEIEHTMSLFLLDEMLDEESPVMNDYGYLVYDQIADEFGIDRSGLAALAIVVALSDGRGPEKAAKQMLRRFKDFEASGLTGGQG